MPKNRRLVEDFIFRDEQSTSSMSLDLIILPPEELRYYIDVEEVNKIVASARKNGILEPLLVRPIPDSPCYEVVAGAKRYRAARILKLAEVPVVVRELNNEEALEIALVENFARSGLTGLEEADGVLRLLSMKLNLPISEVPPILHHIQNQLRSRLISTNNVIGEDIIVVVQEVLTALGNIKLDSFISNRLPLLKLPDDILEVLRSGQLEPSKAKAIAQINDEAQRQEIIAQALANQWSLREIRNQVKIIQDFYQPKSSLQESIKEHVNNTLQQLKKSKVLKDPKTAVQVEKLLAQLDALMESEDISK